ncbi:hypothetical protein [Sphingomonas sp. PB4P5]|uniref:hypothetical protein n=1 Tax=Parasphingomonas puruogangriensis TaxID=3096155 RepID=UPI002FCBF756
MLARFRQQALFVVAETRAGYDTVDVAANAVRIRTATILIAPTTQRRLQRNMD